MLVSIFTDASHDPFKNVAGWGVWAKSERGDMRYAGAFKESVERNTDAEFMAVCNGLHAALKSGVLQDGDTALVQTDCTSVIELFVRCSNNGDPKHLNKRSQSERDVMVALEAFLKDHNVTLQLRHVKGHKKLSKREKRHHVNVTTDKLARLGLEFARKGRDVPEAKALTLLNSDSNPKIGIINVQRLLQKKTNE